MTDTAPEPPICRDCDGEGVVDCMSCGGEGIVGCDDCDGQDADCAICGGNGAIDCDICDGSSEQPCPWCDGTGNAVDTLDASDSEAESEHQNDHEFLDKPVRPAKPKGD